MLSFPCLQVLEAANGGVTKTKIMYKAFLSYSQLREYPGVLVHNDLLANNTPGSYTTTGKGLHFLDITRKMDGLFQIRAIEESGPRAIQELKAI